MSNLVIAAIPDENDRVWRVSSEKIPHLTVLFLGEVDAVANLESIVGFVEHAVSTTLRRFYLPVDRRGELGEDKADVLFFKKGRYDYKAIRDFRAALLQDSNIKTAYDNSEQHEGPWQPHLTLGYPASPAKTDNADQDGGFFDVCFNKIAVWIDDFDGPEFLLKDYFDEYEALESVPMDVAMSDIQHFGTKGMKWGVRSRDRRFATSQKKMAKALDQEERSVAPGTGTFKKNFLQGRARSNRGKSFQLEDSVSAEIRQKTLKSSSKEIKDLRKRPEFQKINYRDAQGHPQFDSKKFSALEKEEARIWGEHLNKNVAGQQKFDVKVSKSGGTWTVRSKQVQHADEEVPVMLLRPIRDDEGYIIDLEVIVEEENTVMAQTVDLGDEFVLEHFGTKGMKWGVSKAKSAGKGIVTLGKDIAYESQVRLERKQREVVTAAGRKFNDQDVPRINAKYKETKAESLGSRLKNPLHKDTIAYRSESRIAYRDRINEAVNALPTNASKTRKYEIEDGGRTNAQYLWALKVVDIKRVVHADIDANMLLGDFNVQPIFDKDGFIIDVKWVGNSIAQTADLGANFLAHYGKKGMKWGVRNEERKSDGSFNKWLDPEGKNKTSDLIKGLVWPIFPVLVPFAIPAQTRLIRGSARGVKSKSIDAQEKRFEKKAASAKNFVEIHNGAGERINRELVGLNKKHSGDLTKDPAKQKAYDDDVLKLTQDAYRESANAIGNKANTRHLDVAFKGDGMDFHISAKEGPRTPLPSRIKHAADDEDIVTFHAKIKRDATGHIVGMEFEDFESPKMVHSVADLGAEFVIEHFGVKGMRWGQRREAPTAVATTSTSVVPHGKRRKTKIKAEGGENHPAHTDAIKVAESRVKLKKSGTAALSNQELRELANRIQLENQVVVLTSSKGRRFVSKQFETETQNLARSGAKASVKRAAPHVIKKAKRAAATAATTAVLL